MKQKNIKGQKPDTELISDVESELLPFLLDRLKGKSRNNVKSLLTHKEVVVNGKIVTRHDHRLYVGSKVTIRGQARGGAKNIPSKMLDIIYEDNEIIVIDKPAGLLSIATEREKENTAYRMLMEYVKSDDPNARVYIVHRLDRDTSGVLLIAKNEQIKHALQDNWNDNVIKRGYICVVEGMPKEKDGAIRSWLLETKTHLMYSSKTHGDGLEAITSYKVIEAGEKYALLDINLETGRKNQIRVHMKDMGNSIAGDKKYGAKTNPLRRLCLHANLLELTHPVTGAHLRFEAKLPKGFSSLIKEKI